MENYKYKIVYISCWIFLWVINLNIIISHYFVEGKQVISKNNPGLKHKGTVKTIMIPEYGEVIDCVDFYKQPAFDDPLIKTLPVDPDLYPPKTKTTNHRNGLDHMLKDWYKYGDCPNGTIAIARTNGNIERKKGHPLYSINGYRDTFEYAIVKHPVRTYLGARADINLWNPRVSAGSEFSVAQIWLESGVETFWENMNTIEAGWRVHTSWKFRDKKIRFFIYWTIDNYKYTGCFNVECSGFIKTHKAPVFEMPLGPISRYNESGHIITVSVSKSKSSGNWVLKLNEEEIGYWPYKFFTSLANKVESIEWGGVVGNINSGGHHTSTQMGSGHFPSEGFNKAAYISELMFMNPEYRWAQVDAYDLDKFTTRDECYDLRVQTPSINYGTYFFYGGPGYSSRCK